MSSENIWNSDLYEAKHAFVWQYGEDLISLLNPQPGEKILDLGCGTGQLTAQISQTGAEVMGIDHSSTMISTAKANYPQIEFVVADGKNFQLGQLFDAVFSNAALHWILEAKSVINCIWRSLKPGGRFVAEFGGKGNIQAIATALFQVLETKNHLDLTEINPWYFPSIGEYTTLLEQQGFDVKYAVLFERPTPLADGDLGLANWLEMFTNSLLSRLDQTEKAEVIKAVEQQLRPILYDHGKWSADYRRIRVIAWKNELRT